MLNTGQMFALSGLFFLIAVLYSSVGFGGGSSYLAILSLFVTDFLQLKAIALLCNLVVVAGGSYLFYKEGLFDKKRFVPLAFLSVPAAFVGATIRLNQKIFFILLGFVLALSGVLLMIQLFSKSTGEVRLRNSDAINIGLGASTGFLSGLVGIGGGILLSPILNLLRWDKPKRIAALASFFILVNSVAGLLGQTITKSTTLNINLLLALLIAVFAGGQIGTRLSLQLLKPEIVKFLTGLLVSYIGLKLVLKHMFALEI